MKKNVHEDQTKKNEKNYRKEKIEKLKPLDDNIKKGMKQNKSFNLKKPKSISTDNNIYNF